MRLRDELADPQAALDLPLVLITHDEDGLRRFGDAVIEIAAAGRALPAHRRGAPALRGAAERRGDRPGARLRPDPGAQHEDQRAQPVPRHRQPASGRRRQRRVEPTLASGARIVAIVTRESAEQLGLQVGATAFALIKASSIVLATELDGVRLSARNQLSGTVAAVTPGAVNAEVVLQLGGGIRIAAVVTQPSVQALGLAVGRPATALFKASSVILGVMA